MCYSPPATLLPICESRGNPSPSTPLAFWSPDASVAFVSLTNPKHHVRKRISKPLLYDTRANSSTYQTPAHPRQTPLWSSPPAQQSHSHSSHPQTQYETQLCYQQWTERTRWVARRGKWVDRGRRWFGSPRRRPRCRRRLCRGRGGRRMVRCR